MTDLFTRTALKSAAFAAAFGASSTVNAQEVVVQDEGPVLLTASLPDDYVLPAGKEHMSLELEAETVPLSKTERIVRRVAAERKARRMRVISREVAWQILNAIDAAQTIDCINRPNCREMNPILGPQPSTSDVLFFKSAAGGAHLLITHLLNKQRSSREVNTWQLVTMGVQGVGVAWNFTQR